MPQASSPPLSSRASTLPAAASGVIFLCFLLSGASALVYQVAWVRHLTLILGATSLAVSTVLTAFMAGLALGSYLAGRWIDRRGRPLVVYAALELVIGAYALLLPWVFQGMAPLYEWVWAQFHPQFYTFSLLRFGLAFLVLLVPTTCMGATLPVLAKFYALAPGRFSLNVNQLYAVNTTGAVIGTLAAGFFLMPQLGLAHTVLTASATNFGLAALLAWVVLAARPPQRAALLASSWRETAPTEGQDIPMRPAIQRFLLASVALTGFCALALEVAWTRVLSLVLGPSVYAFSIMLATFLIGLALGGFAVARLLARWRPRVLAFLFGLQLAIGLAVFGSLLLFGQLPFWYAFLYFRWDVSSFDSGLTLQFALAFVVMLMPTLMMGGMFPALIHAFDAERARAGRSVGRLYAGNTLGAIVGAFAAGYVLIPWLGIQGTVVLVVGAYLALAAATGWLAGRGWALRVGLALAAGAMVALWLPTWNPMAMSSGMNHYAWWLKPDGWDDQRAYVPTRDDFNRYVENMEVLFYREDVDTTVAVARELNVPPQSLGDQTVDSVLLINNGKIDASSHYDMPTQILSGHLGPLLHPGQPRNALVIGLASGTTAGSLLHHPIDALDVVEISEGTVKASHYFDNVNGHPLDDARTNLAVNDGRNHLLVTPQRYDVIVSEPPNPWISGPANLFTREFFELAAARLAPDGVFVQWVQLYAMSSENLKALLKTFHGVFPHLFVFSGLVQSDLLLVGARGPLTLDLDTLQSRMARTDVAHDLARIGLTTVADLLARFRLGSEEVARLYDAHTPLNTDDNALIEYAAPRDLYRNTRSENNRLLESLTQGPVPYLTGLPQGEALNALYEAVAQRYRSLGLATSAQRMAEAGGQ